MNYEHTNTQLNKRIMSLEEFIQEKYSEEDLVNISLRFT